MIKARWPKWYNKTATDKRLKEFRPIGYDHKNSVIFSNSWQLCSSEFQMYRNRRWH